MPELPDVEVFRRDLERLAHHRESIRKAVEAAPRRLFLPEQEVPLADEDMPLPIGYGQTNSQPSTVTRMLSLLAPAPGLRALDVGCGTGWTTALLAHLVGPQGAVIGMEIVPELAERARSIVAGLALPWAQVRSAESGVLGWSDEAPFDRILVSAEADSIPTTLVDQLGREGVLVAPWAGRLHRVHRDGDGQITMSEHGEYRFVPLL